jgi:hypothetical protein
MYEYDRYNVKLTGVSGLLMHFDNIQWADDMKKWETDSENKKNSVAGDDRTPAFRWLGCLYHDSKLIGIPSDNLMTAIREGGVKVPTGKRGGSFKKQSQSGILVDQQLWPIVTSKGTVSWPACAALLAEKDFEKHQKTALDLGFELFVRRVVIGTKKHIRVRPRFESWSIEGSVTVTDETITQSVLQRIFDCAGTYCGLCDWRPSAKMAPGPFGRFTAEVSKR